MVEEKVTPTFKPAEEMVISDLETLRVLADPMRLSIIEYLTRPGTVKRIAEKLGKPPTKLYYHFNLLEKHELIKLVDTRIVSGIIEKHYQASAKSYRLERGLLSPGAGDPGAGLDLALSSLYADVRNDIMESVRNGVVKLADDAPLYDRLFFEHQYFQLTREQAADFITRYKELVAEFQAKTTFDEMKPDVHPYKLMFIHYPSSRSLEQDSDSDDE